MPIHGVDNVKKAIRARVKSIDKQLLNIWLDGLNNVADGTPIDEGATRNNWFLKVGSPFSGTTELKTGNNSLNLRMPKSVLGKKIFYANNKPNIGVLEFGGFPNPAKLGTWNSTTKSYEIHTKGGYSDQAVGGWVRRELKIMQLKVKKIK